MAELNVNKYVTRKSYNGQPLQEGMVQVPVWFSRSMVNADKSILSQNLTTWKFGGFGFLIGFAPIEPQSYENYMKWFWKQINEYLESKRSGRCIIGRTPEGKPVLCQAKQCKSCQDRNKYERYNPAKEEVETVSLDELYDNDDFEIEDHNQLSPEDEVMMEATLDALIEHLRSIKPRYADIASLGYSGLSMEEIIEQIHLKPSRGYQEIDACYQLARDFIYGNK